MEFSLLPRAAVPLLLLARSSLADCGPAGTRNALFNDSLERRGSDLRVVNVR
jgi:hypothetical protein